MPPAWTVRRITRTMLPLLVVLTAIELGSGLVLESLKETLLDAPSLLVLVPVTIGLAGNLGSVLAARLSTALHLGLLEFHPRNAHLAGNALGIVAVATTVFPLVGAGAWLVQGLVGTTALSVGTVVLVSALSGLVLAVVVVVVAVWTTLAAYWFRLDPDDVVVPVVTNVCDVVGVLVLFVVVRALVT